MLYGLIEANKKETRRNDTMRPWLSNRSHRRHLHQAVWLKPGFAALSLGVALYVVATLQPPKKMSTPSTPLPAPDFYTNVRQAPISFIPNQGQVDQEVAYYVQGRDTSLYFTSQGVTFVLTDTQPEASKPTVQSVALRKEPPTARSRYVLKLDFVGANPQVRPRGEETTEAVVSYFTGPQDQWQVGLPTYSKIVYANLWPGIDLVYSGTNSRLKYAFVVQPGADPAQVRLAYRGATGLTLTDAGQLAIGTPVGELRDEKPYSYQEQDGRQQEVRTSYQLHPSASEAVQEYGFQVGSYDRSHPLIIDPAVIVYSGFIGGSSHDEGQSIAVDNAGNAYITGYTNSATGFPKLVGPDLVENGTNDAFVAKVRANGSGLIYAGYIGGLYEDFGYDIAVDSAGNAYVTGYTFSNQTTFPVKIGPDTTFNVSPTGNEDAFVAKVNPAGTALVYCGYIGGPASDRGFGIAIDRLGNAYVTGETTSATPLPALIGPDTTANGGPDAFIAKVRADGTGLMYAGYIGGDSSDYGYDVAVDSTGSAYIIGRTFSYENKFPDGDGFGTLPGPDRTYASSSDAFVAKVKPDGTGLVYAGYVGGSGVDIGNGIAVDELGNAYLTGETNSLPGVGGFPVLVGPDLVHNGNTDAFVVKVKANGSGFDYAGYIGGSLLDQGNSIAVDPVGNAYVTGRTDSNQATFPEVQGPDLTYNLSTDAFVAKVTFDGTRLVYAGYLGGSSDELGFGVAVNSRGDAYFTGRTGSAGFPARIGPILTPPMNYQTFVTKVATFPLVGIGWYRPSTGVWYFDVSRNGRWEGCVIDDCQGPFPAARPVVGDWDGSGTAKIGSFYPNVTPALTIWRLDKNGDGVFTNCTQDRCIGPFGALGDIAVAGDWTFTGTVKTAKIGVFRPSDRLWRLDLNNNGLMDDVVRGPFGLATDKPVVGDWTGNGIAKIGVYRPSDRRWYLDSDNDGVLEACGTVGIICRGPFGTATDRPVVGDWTGDGRAKIGFVRPNATLNNLQWFLDRNNNGVLQGCNIDLCRGPFGAATDIPVAGAW
jgi:hypothetical protein